ncbi:MAG: hypothetical protein JSW55_16715 [Chloroflexota bacterium]|nr:MAG: hypothetical protein JSW55_16715 [Chloroflexota bacterium]
MSFHETVNDLADDAEQLEQVYQAALKAGETAAFQEAIDASHAKAPQNLLYAAWFHRLQYAAAQAKGYVVAWAWVLPLAAVNALLFWWLSGDQFTITIEGFRGRSRDFMPAIVLLGASLSALFVLIYFIAVGQRRERLGALIGILLLAAGAYVLLIYPQLGTIPFQEQYLTLMAIHLPLLAWAGVGVFLLARRRDPTNRFAFLIKSLEVVIVGGLFVIAGGLFTAITIGLFEALDVNFPELAQRLFIAGGIGLITVVAVAVIYNPAVPPAEQSFDEGLSKLVALLMRFMLPLTLLVLLVYLIFILFNFQAPFENREVLIIYNAMLFAVVALLVGATPVSLADISPRTARWLRLGIMTVAALALLVSLYALAAILYRTSIDRLTPNRLTFIGWNVINIGLLFALLLFQLRAKEGRWLQGLFRAFSLGTVAYAVWTLAVILVTPWLFGIDQGGIEALPPAVQEIIYEQPDPILLKCSASPHIYLLEDGEKRWIDTIETFDDRGYVWRDVIFITCNELRSIPDGVPIPADAGLPPQP